MKRGLLFFAGLLCGVALGMLFGSLRGGSGADLDRAAGSGRGAGGSGATVASAIDAKGDGPSSRSGKGGWKEGAVQRPAAGTDIMEYLAELSRADDIEEINFMELVRNASLVTRMSEAEVVAMMEVLKQTKEDEDEDNELNQVFEAILFSRMAELNGPEAMRLILEGELGERWDGDEEALMGIGMTAWVGADPDGAAAWFRQASGNDPKFQEYLKEDEVQVAFFSAMARADGAKARELLLEVGSEVAGDGVEAVARHVKTTEGLVELLDSTSGNGQLDVLREMSERDPQAAARWLEDQGHNARHDDMVANVGWRLMEEDVEAGAAWYMEQEISADAEAHRYSNVVGQWAAQDATQAEAWLAQQPDGPARDRAELVLAHQFARNSDWAGGFRWAGELGEGPQREKTVNRILEMGWDESGGGIQEGAAEAARAAGFEAELERFVEGRESAR